MKCSYQSEWSFIPSLESILKRSAKWTPSLRTLRCTPKEKLYWSPSKQWVTQTDTCCQVFSHLQQRRCSHVLSFVSPPVSPSDRLSPKAKVSLMLLSFKWKQNFWSLLAVSVTGIVCVHLRKLLFDWLPYSTCRVIYLNIRSYVHPLYAHTRTHLQLSKSIPLGADLNIQGCSEEEKCVCEYVCQRAFASRLLLYFLFFIITVANISVTGCGLIRCVWLYLHLLERSSRILYIINIPADGVACHHGHNLPIFMALNFPRSESLL